MTREQLETHLTLMGWEPFEYHTSSLTMWGLQTVAARPSSTDQYPVVRMVYETMKRNVPMRLSPLRDLVGIRAKAGVWESVDELSLRRLAHYVETGSDPIPDR